MRYKFTRRYISGAGHYGAGQVVDMDERLAAWFNRDDPGCLVPFVPENVTTTEEVRAVDAPEHDRMERGKKRRKSA